MNNSADKAIRLLPANYLECRSIGHSWRIGDTTAVPEDADKPERLYGKQAIVRTLECERCSAVREDWYQRRQGTLRRFEKATTRYRMPAGYLWQELVTRYELEDPTAPERWQYNDVLIEALIDS